LYLYVRHQHIFIRRTFGTHAFSVSGPRVWNSLPDHLQDPAVDPEQFRQDLTFEALAH